DWSSDVCSSDLGLTVPTDHLPHFGDALRDMHGKGKTTLLRQIMAVAQQIGAAGIDLHWRDDTRQAAAGMRLRPLDDAERRIESGAAARLVPAVVEFVIIFHVP